MRTASAWASRHACQFYDEELTGQYNAWLKQQYSAEQLQEIRDRRGRGRRRADSALEGQ